MTDFVAYTLNSPTDTALIDRCIGILVAGGVIIYPTDTVYGLGADATNPVAVALVRAIKGRDHNKPILALVTDISMLEEYVLITPLARRLADEFWPGPLSLVATARNDHLAAIRSPDGSIGARSPNHSFCRALTRAFGKPITSTSVNRSGEPQVRAVDSMLLQLGTGAEQVALAIDMGATVSCVASTVVDARGQVPIIVREGAVLQSRIFGLVGT